MVDANDRGSGIGRALLRVAESELLRTGCVTIEVTSHMRHAPYHGFYEHMGYERTSVRFAKSLE